MKINEIFDMFSREKSAEKKAQKQLLAQQGKVLAYVEKSWQDLLKRNNINVNALTTPEQKTAVSKLLGAFAKQYFISDEDKFVQQQVANAFRSNPPKGFDANSIKQFFSVLNTARLQAKQGNATDAPVQDANPNQQTVSPTATVPQKQNNMSVIYFPTSGGNRTFWYNFNNGKWMEFTGTNFPADLSTSQVVNNPKEIDAIAGRVAKGKVKFVPYGSQRNKKRTKRRK